jgi:hypothetical protein
MIAQVDLSLSNTVFSPCSSIGGSPIYSSPAFQNNWPFFGRADPPNAQKFAPATWGDVLM